MCHHASLPGKRLNWKDRRCAADGRFKLPVEKKRITFHPCVGVAQYPAIFVVMRLCLKEYFPYGLDIFPVRSVGSLSLGTL